MRWAGAYRLTPTSQGGPQRMRTNLRMTQGFHHSRRSSRFVLSASAYSASMVAPFQPTNCSTAFFCASMPTPLMRCLALTKNDLID